MSVKFTDDNGISEGAVDLGGPMGEFFTLILDHLHRSQLFCGLENHRLLSYQSKCIQDDGILHCRNDHGNVHCTWRARSTVSFAFDV